MHSIKSRVTPDTNLLSQQGGASEHGGMWPDRQSTGSCDSVIQLRVQAPEGK
jgi:hypothetical protein